MPLECICSMMHLRTLHHRSACVQPVVDILTDVFMYTYHSRMQSNQLQHDLGPARVCAGRTACDIVQWGAVQGAIALSHYVFARAAQQAADYYLQAEKAEFCGDDVYVASAPPWLPDVRTWFPAAAVAALGFERVPNEAAQLIATVGVDSHDDHIHGPAFVLVLSNDGLKFRQGRQSHETCAGEWFLFDDRRLHSVLGRSKKSTTYLCVSIGLRSIRRA